MLLVLIDLCDCGYFLCYKKTFLLFVWIHVLYLVNVLTCHDFYYYYYFDDDDDNDILPMSVKILGGTKP